MHVLLTVRMFGRLLPEVTESPFVCTFTPFWWLFQYSCLLFLWHLFHVPVFGSLSLFSEQEGYMDLWSAPGHGPLLNTSYFICSWWMKPCMYVIHLYELRRGGTVQETGGESLVAWAKLSEVKISSKLEQLSFLGAKCVTRRRANRSGRPLRWYLYKNALS